MSRHGKTRSRRWVGWSIVVIVVVGVVGTGLGFWQAGYRPFIVHTGSMAPTHPSGDLLIVRPADSYQVGEVITFRHSADPTDLVTHRITEVTPEGFHTKGDANPTADVWTIRRDMVIGSAVAGLPDLGYAVYFLQQPTGIAAVILAVIAIFLLWTLFFPAQTRRTETAEDAEPGTDPIDSSQSNFGPADPGRTDADDPVLAGQVDSVGSPDLNQAGDDRSDDELFDRLLSLSS